jgi:peptide/nickel transport system substrate-binding protein
LGSEPTLTRRNDINDWVPYVSQITPSFENGYTQFVGDGADRFLQVVFDLRDDVVWSDGTKLTAQDFVFAWQLIMSPDYPVAGRTFESKLSSMSAEGDFRVIVRFMSQSEAREAARSGRNVNGPLPPSFFSAFTTQDGPVVDPSYYKGYPAFPRHVLEPLIAQVGVAGLAQHAINRAPLGVGPFKVSQWVPGQYIALDSVPTYFLGAPRTQSLLFKIVSDTNAVFAQLATGEADVVTEDALNEFYAPDLDRIERQRVIRAHFTVGATWEHIDLNLDNPHLQDLRVRQAITYALNRQRIVDSVLNGKTSVIHNYAPTWRWDYSPEITRYNYDPAKARQLLRDAGYTPGSDGIMQKSGQKLSLRYQTTSGNQARLLSSQIEQQDLKEVGVEIKLEYLPAGEFFAAGDNPGPLTARTFELGRYAWVAGDDPVGTKNLYHSESIPSKANSFVGQNYPGIKNAKLDELLHQAENSIDQAQRTIWYAEAQKLWTDLLPVVPLFARANVTAISRTLQNFRPTPTNTPPTWNAHDWWKAD